MLMGGNCSYRVISTLLSKGEDNHAFVYHQLIQELRNHKESYAQLYGKKENFDEVYESLVPCLIGPTPEAKLMCFLEIGCLIACAYDKVCIDLTRYDCLKEKKNHYAPPHLKIQIIISYVLGGFQNHNILFKFT